jgi:hypothetical protein
VEFDGWREADQRYYVSDTRRFESATGWSPQVSVTEGVRALHSWLAAARLSPAGSHGVPPDRDIVNAGAAIEAGAFDPVRTVAP